jgi:hypothetical protein
MTVILELEPAVESTAAEQAKAEGLPLAKYVETVVKEAVFKRQKIEQMSDKPFDEILKPFRDEVESSGMTDNELDELFHLARTRSSEARRSK